MMKIISIASSLLSAKQLDNLDNELGEEEDSLNMNLIETNIEEALESAQKINNLLDKAKNIIAALNKNIVKAQGTQGMLKRQSVNPYFIDGGLDGEGEEYFQALQEKIELIPSFFIPIIEHLRGDSPMKAFNVVKDFIDSDKFYGIKDKYNLEDIIYPYTVFLFNLKSINIGLTADEEQMLNQAKVFRNNLGSHKTGGRENVITIMSDLISLKHSISLSSAKVDINAQLKEQEANNNREGAVNNISFQDLYEIKILKLISMFPSFDEGDYFERDCMLDGILVDYCPKEVMDDINRALFKATSVNNPSVGENYEARALSYKEYVDLMNEAKKALFKGETQQLQTIAEKIEMHISTNCGSDFEPGVIIELEDKKALLNILKEMFISILEALDTSDLSNTMKASHTIKSSDMNANAQKEEGVARAYQALISHLSSPNSFFKFSGKSEAMLLDLECDRYARSLIGLNAVNINQTNNTKGITKSDEKILDAIELFRERQLIEPDPFADFIIDWAKIKHKAIEASSQFSEFSEASYSSLETELARQFIDRFAFPKSGDTFSKDYEVDKAFKNQVAANIINLIDAEIGRALETNAQNQNLDNLHKAKNKIK